MHTIKEASKKDMNEVLAMVRLGEYEKLSDKITFAEDDFIDNIFKKNYAQVLISKHEGKINGYAIYYFTFSTCLGKGGIFLEDLYVRESYRSHGIGKQFLQTLAQICVENDLKRLEWHCLDWNEPSIVFYENLGAKHLFDWRNYQLDGEDLQNLANER